LKSTHFGKSTKNNAIKVFNSIIEMNVK